MPLTRREFNAATTASIALTVLGCDSSTSQSNDKGSSNPSHKAHLATQAFLIGSPDRYATPGLYPGFEEEMGVWVVSDGQTLVVLSATCTHLACSTQWDAANQEFMCPCHESRFDLQGINGEDSKAKRPLERCALRLIDTSTGQQVQVDPTRRFRQDKDQWSDPASLLPLT